MCVARHGRHCNAGATAELQLRIEDFCAGETRGTPCHTESEPESNEAPAPPFRVTEAHGTPSPSLRLTSAPEHHT